MKQSFAVLGLFLVTGLVSGEVLAEHRPIKRNHSQSYYDYAKVVQVEPIIRVVSVPATRHECWEEDVTHYPEQGRQGVASYTPAILGGIIGGVVGNQFGKGSGKDAMTVAGALLGTSVGYEAARRPVDHAPYVTREQRCQTRTQYHEEEQIDGYWVTYRYHGREFVHRMDYHPRHRIKVKISVRPVDD